MKRKTKQNCIFQTPKYLLNLSTPLAQTQNKKELVLFVFKFLMTKIWKRFNKYFGVFFLLQPPQLLAMNNTKIHKNSMKFTLITFCTCTSNCTLVTWLLQPCHGYEPLSLLVFPETQRKNTGKHYTARIHID